MAGNSAHHFTKETVWLSADQCSVDDLAALTARQTRLEDHPFAQRIEKNIPIYDGARLRAEITTPENRRAVMAEWVEVFARGPGVIVVKQAVTDLAALASATDLFNGIIDEQHRQGTGGGDHFAKPGANDRIWNALEKHCLRDPEGFARYYSSELVALACEAWLGPAYQMTAQVNCVNPGGAAQSAHRDYHLGFQTAAQIERYPAHVHRLSPVLTLQGAVAHCDMPIESGPTLFLPYSQTYVPGYLATGLPAFKAFFEAHHVQLPLQTGDAVFFNPALFHAAGHNRSQNIRRMANLLQISSAYGRAMETVNRSRMSLHLFPALKQLREGAALSPDQIACAIAACAEGYSFPTNLDSDPPIGGLAPVTQAQLMARALEENWDVARFAEALQAQDTRRLA